MSCWPGAGERFRMTLACAGSDHTFCTHGGCEPCWSAVACGRPQSKRTWRPALPEAEQCLTPFLHQPDWLWREFDQELTFEFGWQVAKWCAIAWHDSCLYPPAPGHCCPLFVCVYLRHAPLSNTWKPVSVGAVPWYWFPIFYCRHAITHTWSLLVSTV
jgi:hypothetical protein